jgi:hypothetical protein
LTVAGYADVPLAMAPPIQSFVDQTSPTDTTDGTQDSVFNWSEVPDNQQVPITRAVFDQSGYQLYDNVGETIVVPFTNDNLYVMKFAVSDNGDTYFVRDGDTPTLYIPRDGYLENATVSGARWYPFTQDFQPTEPVYLGIAPSWDAFVDMGWYPDMSCWGGYWGSEPFVGGGFFLPTVGLTFIIGGHSCYGWAGYHSWLFEHPAPFRTGIRLDRDDLGSRNRPIAAGHTFGGFGNQGSNGTRGFAHYTYNHGGRSFSSGQPSYSVHEDGFDGGGRSFRNGGSTFGSGRTFGGSRPASTGWNFGGGDWNRGGSNGGQRSFVGGGRSFGGGWSGNDQRSYGGGAGGGQRSGGGGWSDGRRR